MTVSQAIFEEWICSSLSPSEGQDLLYVLIGPDSVENANVELESLPVSS